MNASFASSLWGSNTRIVLRMKLTRSLLATFTFAAGSALNPAYFAGCGAGGDDADFEYGAKELRALVEQANGSFTLEAKEVSHCSATCTLGAVPYRVELELSPESQAQASANPSAWPGMRAHACGNRELFASASACIDSSSMDVQGRVKITRLDGDEETLVAEAADVKGTLRVLGLKLSHAELTLRFEAGDVSFIAIDGQRLGRPQLHLRP